MRQVFDTRNTVKWKDVRMQEVLGRVTTREQWASDTRSAPLFAQRHSTAIFATPPLLHQSKVQRGM